jgi:tetratricopeptide (TPR) repeat protein
LVQKFINNEDENSFLKVILEMSYLKRRYTRQIFEHRRGQYTNIRDWIHLKGELANYPFVKYYSSSDSFVLHDEFQRMIEEHGRGIFIDKAVELRDDIVKGLYEKFINDAHDDDIKSLLRVEQLAYILNIGGVNDQHQVAPGYQLVDYELAKKKLLEYYQLRSYILDGFLVSEVSTETIVGFPEDDRDELLSLFGQMAQRIYRYEDAQIYWGSVAKYAESIKDYERQVEALISLHSNAWRSNPAQAFEILDQAFEVCEKHVEKLLPRVLNAIGFNYARFQRFEEAIKEYQKALAEVNEGEHRHLKATILNNLGSAYLQIGKMAKAKAHTDAGRRLRQTILEEMIAKKDSSGIETAENRLGYSFVILGTLARYSDDLTSADDEYSYAISIFEKYNDQFARANALLCRGETHRRIARLNFENDQIESVEENEDLAEIDIRAGFDICQQYGLINLLDTAYRRKGRLLHDQGYRAAEVDIKLEYYDKALVEFENALEIAVQTGDVREELENLREIAFLADDHADVVINTENDDKSKIQEEFEQLNAYIARFENSLKKHEKDVYRLYNYDAFQALLILEKAAFAYAREQRDDALNLYIRAFVTLAKSPGYGVANYLIYLPHLFKNIRNLKNPVLEKIWCGKIKDVWEKEKLDNVREEMMANIEVHLLAIGEG